MRNVIKCFLLCALFFPCFIGCGSSRPDPRDQPDFVDDTDPDVTIESMDDTAPDASKQGAEKTGTTSP